MDIGERIEVFEAKLNALPDPVADQHVFGQYMTLIIDEGRKGEIPDEVIDQLVRFRFGVPLGR